MVHRLLEHLEHLVKKVPINKREVINVGCTGLAPESRQGSMDSCSVCFIVCLVLFLPLLK